jgi:tetratricopeptide repeat protein
MADPLLKPPINDYEKPVLVPPDSQLDNKQQRRQTTLYWSILGFVLLLGVAIMLIGLQPPDLTNNIPSTPSAAAITHQPVQQLTSQNSADTTTLLKLQDDWLRLLVMAENENIAAWAGDEFSAITAAVLAADKLLSHGKQEKAIQGYQHSIDTLQQLLASKQQRLDTALTKGYLALERQKSASAIQAFSSALSIEAENQQGIKGLRRASQLDQVIAHYQQGLAYETNGELTAARKALSLAVQLDADFVPAKLALARVDQHIVAQRFSKVMSDALLAIQKGDLQSASAALAEATRLKPKNPALIEAKVRLATVQKANTLEKLRIRADQLAASEQWSKAMHVYEQVLLTAPQASFAIEGKFLAQKHIELHDKISAVINKPQRLKEDGPLAEARQTLLRARSYANPGPKLLRQIEQLEALINNAATLLPVILSSDNMTNVVVYQVGRLGNFLEKHLTLRPGNYTVVGSRPGFRDVRLTLVVKASNQPILLSIRCEEQV